MVKHIEATTKQQYLDTTIQHIDVERYETECNELARQPIKRSRGVDATTRHESAFVDENRYAPSEGATTHGIAVIERRAPD